MRIQERLAKISIEDFQRLTTNDRTHIENHIGNRKVDNLNRIFTDKPADSTFANADQVPELVLDACLYNAEEIENWQKNACPYETKAFTHTFDKEDYGPVGTGILFDKYSNLIKEYETDTIRVILRKDTATPMGFSVHTAYPDMISVKVEPTGHRLDLTAKETNTYQNADDLGKAYLSYRTNPNSKVNISYSRGYDKNGNPDPSDSRIIVSQRGKNPDLTHMVCIKENRFYMYTTDWNHKNAKGRPDKTMDTPYVRLRDTIVKENDYPPISSSHVSLVGKSNIPIRDLLFQECPELLKAADFIRKQVKEKKPYEKSYAKQAENMMNRTMTSPNNEAEDQYQ